MMATKGSHKGEVTHHQDQVATLPMPANLRTKNTMNRMVHIPPVPLFAFEFFIYLFI